MPNPLVFPCSKRRTCPGVDLPIDNYSAEGAEPGPPYFAVVFPEPPNRPPREFFQQMGCLFMCTSWNSQAEVDACIAAQTPFCQEPPPGFFYAWGCKSVCVSSISQADADACAEAQLSQCQNDSVWQGQGCVSLCTSYVSQEDADLCALRQASQCTNGSDGGGGGNDGTGGGGGSTPQCNNTEVSCTYTLPDGTRFTYVVPAGTFCDETVAIANAQALAYACQQSSNPNVNIALSDLVASCCNGDPLSKRITITQNSQTGDWTLHAGSVPNGLTLHVGAGDNVLLDGTPVALGDYTFTVRFTTPTGHTAERDYTIKVEQCGSTPVDMGCPTGCSSGTLFAYYGCEASPDVDEVGTHNLTVYNAGFGLNPPVIASGIHGNAFEGSSDPAHLWYMRNAPGFGTSDWDFSGINFAVRFWHYIPTFGSVGGVTLFGTTDWSLLYGFYLDGDGYYWRTKDVFGSMQRISDLFIPTVGWHYIIAWRCSNRMGIRIDNRPIVLSPAGILPMKSTLGLEFTISGAFAPMAWRFDEIAIWKGCIPSGTQIDDDYNAGLGKFYPNVPGA